jgi:hypothetical protein
MATRKRRRCDHRPVKGSGRDMRRDRNHMEALAPGQVRSSTVPAGRASLPPRIGSSARAPDRPNRSRLNRQNRRPRRQRTAGPGCDERREKIVDAIAYFDEAVSLDVPATKIDCEQSWRRSRGAYHQRCDDESSHDKTLPECYEYKRTPDGPGTPCRNLTGHDLDSFVAISIAVRSTLSQDAWPHSYR